MLPPDQSEKSLVEGSDSSTASDRPARGSVFDRRGLLRLVSVTTVTSLAGCSRLGDFLDGDDAGGPTSTYGYGGSPTAATTATPIATATRTGGATSTTTRTNTQAGTDTAARTATSVPEDDYGEQGYGQYGYGGTR